MYVWTEIERLQSQREFEAKRWEVMCCSVSYQTETATICEVCNGDHQHILRRFRCTSETCSSSRTCPVKWKAIQCPPRDEWVVFVNDMAHGRAALNCKGKHKPRVTKEIRAYIAQQADAQRVTPRILEVKLKRNQDLMVPPRGLPTRDQIANILKRIRAEDGMRNTIEGIEDFVSSHVYTPAYENSPEKAFLFGPILNSNGLPRVASGTDKDPFILGVTSLKLIEDSLSLAAPGRFAIFHADATFKLSDYAYPVITCGFTDSARSYQLMALFVVSQRTRRDFRLCFSALSELVRRLRGRPLHVSALMGDADRAQLRGLQDVPDFARATPLMCYFHVLYNVRKKIAPLPLKIRIIVMTGIVDMHLTCSEEEFIRVQGEQLARWRRIPELTGFVTYFTSEWLQSDFWRWQIYHSPAGFATTNNPSEVYHSGMKSYTQHERFHMTKLLVNLSDLVETHKTIRPADANFTPKASTEIIDAAKYMVASGRTTIQYIAGECVVRVLYKRSSQDKDPVDDEAAFVQAFDRDLDIDKKTAASNVAEKRQEAEKKKAAKMHARVNTWYLWRAHTIGTPHDGWLVDYKNANCGCKYFQKFKICAHLVIALNRQDLSALGKKPKILDRSRKRAKTDATATESSTEAAVATLSMDVTVATESAYAPREAPVEQRWCWESFRRGSPVAQDNRTGSQLVHQHFEPIEESPGSAALHSQLERILGGGQAVASQSPLDQPTVTARASPDAQAQQLLEYAMQHSHNQRDQFQYTHVVSLPSRVREPRLHQHLPNASAFGQLYELHEAHGLSLQPNRHQMGMNPLFQQQLFRRQQLRTQQAPYLGVEDHQWEDHYSLGVNQQSWHEPRPLEFMVDGDLQFPHVPSDYHRPQVRGEPVPVRLDQIPRRKRGRQAMASRALEMEDVMN